MDQPIVCDMSNASDTGPERLLEYERLFSQSLVRRERTADGIRFWLRADDGVEAWAASLAAREKACCPFFSFTITTEGGEVRWHASVVDDDIAREILDEFYALPDTVAGGVAGLEDRLRERGMEVVVNPEGTVTHVHKRPASTPS